MTYRKILLQSFLLIFAVSIAQAEPTEIAVRVLSKGAKYVGTSMGGVRILIKDADTGELLAEGITQGSTGDTEKIMKESRKPHDPISTEDSAVYKAVLDLEEPRFVEVTAYGPLAQRQSANRVSMTQWIVPGKHITGGDGWTLIMPGFVVDILSPPAHIKLSGASQEVKITANVTMMCGCPLEPGGLWNSDQFEIAAIVKRNGKKVDTVPLTYAGIRSQMETAYTTDTAGAYEIIVYAYDPADGNTGLDQTTFIVSE